MTVKGIDCAQPLTAGTAAALYAEGYRFAARYLVPERYGWKRLTRREAEDITAAGMQVVSVFETSADRPKGSATAGQTDGREALAEARLIGQPAGSAIYFAVDWDAQPNDCDAIEAYLWAAAAEIKGYVIGVYGSYAVVEEMARRIPGIRIWQTYAWSRGRKSDKAHLYQYQNGVKVAGHPVDLNECYGGAGWWNTKGEIEVAKQFPTIYKERIRVSGGKLQYIQIASAADRATAYSKPGTDVRLIKFERSSTRFGFVSEKGGKVTAIAKREGADFGFNLPFFDFTAQIVVGTVWDGSKYVNGAYGDMVNWYEIGFKDGSARIGKFSKAEREQLDFSVQGKILIENSKLVFKNDGQRCQRTFIGLDAAGNVLLAISDGRTVDDEGLTCDEMALFMQAKGAVWAIEGDGGGSSILYSKTGGTYSPGDRAYNPGGINQAINTSANERTVHHAVLAWIEDATAPQPRYKDSDTITYGDLRKLGLIK